MKGPWKFHGWEAKFEIFIKSPSGKFVFVFQSMPLSSVQNYHRLIASIIPPTGTPTAPTGVKLVMGGLELPSQPPNLDAATLVISLNRFVPARPPQQFVPQIQGLSWAAGALAKHVRR